MLKIVQHPHPALKLKSSLVTEFDENLLNLTQEMISIMNQEQGIGLAANQVNLTKRIFIMHANRDLPPYVFINPEVKPIIDNKINYDEGCLSFPGIIQTKERYSQVQVKWQNINGEFLEKSFDSLEAICIQHENDHINGITFIQHLSPLKQQFALKKLNKPLTNKLKK